MLRLLFLAAIGVLAAGCQRPVERELTRGNELARGGRLEGAQAAFARACELAPGDARAQALHGNALLALGRPAEALAAFERALALDATQPAAIRGMAHLHLQGADAGLALATLATGGGDDTRLRLLRARALLAQGSDGGAEAALAEAEAALTTPPPSPEGLYLKGSAQIVLGRYADAQGTLEALQREAPASPLGPYGLARLAAAQARATDAVLYLKSAQRLSGEAWRPVDVEADPAFTFLRELPEFKELTRP